MNSLEDLLAAEAIRALKARYFRAMDTKEYGLLEDVFTEDAVCDYREAFTEPGDPSPVEEPGYLEGRTAILAYIAEGLTPLRSVHQGFMPEITVAGDEAAAIWPMADRLKLPDSPIAEIIGYGYYHETYRKLGDGWRIATLRLTRLRVDHVSR